MATKAKKVPSTLVVRPELEARQIVMHEALRSLANAAGTHGGSRAQQLRKRRQEGKALGRAMGGD